jgi:polyribonucleotide nucleotidyltransferase
MKAIWTLRLQAQTGITALQMDIKIEGITEEILKEALNKHVLADFIS